MIGVSTWYKRTRRKLSKRPRQRWRWELTPRKWPMLSMTPAEEIILPAGQSFVICGIDLNIAGGTL